MPDNPLNPPIEPEGSGKSGAWAGICACCEGSTEGTHVVVIGGEILHADYMRCLSHLQAVIQVLYEALEAIMGECPQCADGHQCNTRHHAKARAALLKANPLRRSDHKYGPHAGGPPHAV